MKMKTRKLGILRMALFVVLASVPLFGFWSTSEAALRPSLRRTTRSMGSPCSIRIRPVCPSRLCTNAVNCIVTPPVVGNAFSQTIGFGAEMFYFLADSDLLPVGPQVAGGPTDTMLLRLGLEASFSIGDPLAGDQVTFARINLKRVTSGAACTAATLANCILAPSATYTVTHPFGTFTFNTDVNGNANLSAGGQAFRAQDGGAAPLDFVGVLPTTLTGIGGIQPFLTAVAPAPPVGFIGNAALLQTVTGGINANAVTITGPNIGGPAVNSVTTNLWNLSGQVAAFDLSVTLAGNGTGTVTSAPVGISCGPTCNAPFAPATAVTFTAVPSATSVFTSWTGCTPVVGTPTQCTATMNANTTVTATFNEAVNITAAPATIDLGTINVGSTVLRTVTVTNTGATTNLAITPVTLTPATDFTIFTDTCSNASLAPAATCLVELMYLKAAIGASAATLTIPSNDPQTPTMNVTLAATGGLVPVFTDVPAGAFAEDFINTLFYNGITSGCTATTFCPDNSITRKEMAVFLESSLGVTAVPACAGTIFTDVTAASIGAAFCGYIEKLAGDGITGGCGGSNFCPDAPVTRGQMAVFIEAALKNPANACAGQFTDATGALVGAVACGFIEKLAADGITGGCTATTFCPNNPVTRAQMAVFLVAAPAPLIP